MRQVLAALALAMTASQAVAQEPPLRFRAPELVVAIVYDEFALIRSDDELTTEIRARYFDGFAAILNRACRFLPRESHEALRTRLDAAEAGGTDSGVVVSAAAAGIADGRTFTDRFACDHSKAQRAQRHLAALLGAPERRARTN